METHCSILAWKTPWTEEPGGLQSIWSQSQSAETTSCSHHRKSQLKALLAHAGGPGPPDGLPHAVITQTQLGYVHPSKRDFCVACHPPAPGEQDTYPIVSAHLGAQNGQIRGQVHQGGMGLMLKSDPIRHCLEAPRAALGTPNPERDLAAHATKLLSPVHQLSPCPSSR